MLFSYAKASHTNCIAYPTVGHAKVDRNIRKGELEARTFQIQRETCSRTFSPGVMLRQAPRSSSTLSQHWDCFSSKETISSCLD